MTDRNILRSSRTTRSACGPTQAELADRLGVSFATVNRWESGANRPQRAQLAKITTLAEEAGVDLSDAGADSGTVVTRKRGRQAKKVMPNTKPMEQMLWDACSIRGEKDAGEVQDYLLPVLFLKRLSDVFDDGIDRLAEGNTATDKWPSRCRRGQRPRSAPLLSATRGALGRHQRSCSVRLARRRTDDRQGPGCRRAL